MTESTQYRMVQLMVSEAVKREDDLFETTFSHPSLGGKLVLIHGSDRALFLDAICIDPKYIDPVGVFFQHVAELRSKTGD